MNSESQVIYNRSINYRFLFCTDALKVLTDSEIKYLKSKIFFHSQLLATVAIDVIHNEEKKH
jgi:hypothetical protein